MKPFWKKQKDRDCLEQDLPSNRYESFLDIVKNRYDVLLKLGAMFLIFSLPILLTYFGSNIICNSFRSNFNDGGITKEQLGTLILTAKFYESGITAFCILLLSLPFAGAMRIVKRLIYLDGIQFFGDFKLGIKDNGKETFLLSLIFAVTYFICTASFRYGLLVFSDNFLFSLILYSPSILCCFLVWPITLLTIAIIPVYTNPLRVTLSNATAVYGWSALKTLPLSLLVLFPLFLFLIPNIYAVIALLLLYFMILLPLILVAWFEYSFYLIDNYYNLENYREIYDKGIYRKNSGKKNL